MQKILFGDTSFKHEIGQVWSNPSECTKVKIVGFNSGGDAVVEVIEKSVSSFYDLHDIIKLSNPTWVLVPEKKKVEYRVFKSTHTGDVSVFSGANMKSAEKWTVDWIALSDRMVFEYTED